MSNNHVFTCVHCARGWTVLSDARLDCFFTGLCCDCVQEFKISKEEIARALGALCVVKAEVKADNLFHDPLLKVNPEKLVESKPSAAEVREVFEYWKRVCSHPNAVLDAKRSNTITRQLIKFGRSVAELKAAIDGAALDPFIQGQNNGGTRYDDIGLILRDAAHVERYAEVARRSRREQQSLARGTEGAEEYEGIFDRLRTRLEEKEKGSE